MEEKDKIKRLEEELAKKENDLKIKELEEKIKSTDQKMQNDKAIKSNGYEGLYCSSDDKILLGFCGGLAHKFGVQTSIVRFIVFISGFFFVGWFYLAGLFLPKHSTK